MTGRHLSAVAAGVALVAGLLGACTHTVSGPGQGPGGNRVPGALVSFTSLGTDPPDGMEPAELGNPEQLDAFLAPVPDVADEIRSELGEVPDGVLRFGFPLSGCEDESAVLLLDGEDVSAEPRGGEGYNCAAAEHYVAVFDVEAELLPSGATPTDGGR